MAPKEGTAGFTLTCSMTPEDGEDVEIEGASDVGILWRHEYACLGIAEMGGAQLIRIMNPHGRGGEWSGHLPDDVQQQLGPQPPGMFWMPLPAFTDSFTRVDLCQSFAGSGPASWFHWQDQALLQRAMTAHWQHAPQWRLRLEAATEVVVSVTQADLKVCIIRTAMLLPLVLTGVIESCHSFIFWSLSSQSAQLAEEK